MNWRHARFSRAERRSGAEGDSGFTLVELLTVIAILGFLVLTATPHLSKLVETVKVARCAGEIKGLEQQIAAYYIENSVLPNSLNAIGQGALLDPWGNPYQYLDISGGGGQRLDRFLNPLNSDYDLYSKGADGATAQRISEPAGLDDVVRATDGSYLGLASKF